MDATSKDFMQDALAAVDYLQGHPLINKDQISVCGHSEGALLAVMLGAKRRDLASIALLAGPGIKGDSLLLLQQVLIARSEGMKEKQIQELNAFNKKLFSGMVVAKDMSSCREFVEGEFRKYARKLSKKEIKKYGSKEKFVEISTNTFVNPWMLYFLSYDPTLDLTRVTCKVLALNGDKDLQVPSKENLAAIERSVLNVTGNNKYVELPNLNHLFQETKTGAVSEYGQLEQTISPEVLNILSEWFQAP
jgi:pimeloyl-ACP methyl ester carboxylesterase